MGGLFAMVGDKEMTGSVGAKDSLVLPPGRGIRGPGVKASGVVQVLLLVVFVVVVVVGLVCDARRYHGVDVYGQPIYPEGMTSAPCGVWQEATEPMPVEEGESG